MRVTFKRVSCAGGCIGTLKIGHIVHISSVTFTAGAGMQSLWQMPSLRETVGPSSYSTLQMAHKASRDTRCEEDTLCCSACSCKSSSCTVSFTSCFTLYSIQGYSCKLPRGSPPIFRSSDFCCNAVTMLCALYNMDNGFYLA